MNILKMPRIIYFIKGAVPTLKDAAAAMQYGTNVVFRDATKVGDEMLEACEGVAGAIPKKYADAVADVKNVIQHGDDVLKKFVANGAAMFRHGATVTGLEASQLRDNITAEVKAALGAEYDKAITLATDTHARIQAALEADRDAAVTALASANVQIASLEAQLAAALAPKPSQASESAPAATSAQPNAADAPKPAPGANDGGWTANVDPTKQA